jgi:hypothetical protein
MGSTPPGYRERKFSGRAHCIRRQLEPPTEQSGLDPGGLRKGERRRLRLRAGWRVREEWQRVFRFVHPSTPPEQVSVRPRGPPGCPVTPRGRRRGEPAVWRTSRGRAAAGCQPWGRPGRGRWAWSCGWVCRRGYVAGVPRRRAHRPVRAALTAAAVARSRYPAAASPRCDGDLLRGPSVPHLQLARLMPPSPARDEAGAIGEEGQAKDGANVPREGE